MLAKRRTNGEIADELGISLDGAKYHVSEILSKLGTNSRDEAAEWWRQQHGLRARVRVFVRALFAPGMLRWAGLGSAGAGALAAIVVIAAVTFSGRGDGTRTNLPKPYITPAATENVSDDSVPGHPGDLRTGEADVDSVIDVVMSGEPSRLESLMAFYPVDCAVAPQGIPARPECPQGVAVGTPVEVFPNGSCPEGRFATRGTIGVLVQNLANAASRVFAVYRQQPVDPGEWFDFPAGRHVVLLTTPSAKSPTGYSVSRLEVQAGAVITAGIACPHDTAQEIARGIPPGEFLLAPPAGG